MKFSVLMSVYHADDATLLARALDSIYTEQTQKPEEIVVVFDGALTEPLYRTLESFRAGKEDVVRYFPMAENRGLGAALSYGAARCTGDFIVRMDADDISVPTRIEKQSAFLAAHPDVDVLGGDIAEFYDSPSEGNLRVRACPQTHGDIVKMSRRRNPMNHVSVCMRRRALEGCGGYMSLPLLEDYYLWMRMLQAGCVFANLGEVLVYVCIGNGFHRRRGAREQVKSYRFLQRYLYEAGMISRFGAAYNMLRMRALVGSPVWLRRIVYDKLLRK